MHAKIEPIFVGLPAKSATVLRISQVVVNSIGPTSSAVICWAVSDEGAANGFITLAGAAYDAWGTDDSYLLTYTAATLGLTIIEIVPDAAPTPPVAEPAPVEAPAAPPVVEEPVAVVVEAPAVEEPAVAPLGADPAAGSI